MKSQKLTNSGSTVGGSYSNQSQSVSAPFLFSRVVGFDIVESENFAFIYSVQMLTLLMAICDHLVLIIDSMSLDNYLFKLIATALMMVGDGVPKANLIIHQSSSTKTKSSKNGFVVKNTDNEMIGLYKQTITAMLGPNVNLEFTDDSTKLAAKVLRPPSRKLIGDQCVISFTSERSWLHSAQRYWENSIQKSTMFAEYARFLP